MPNRAGFLLFLGLWMISGLARASEGGGAAAGPQRAIGVIRIEQVFQGYEYLLDRQNSIRDQVAPLEAEFNRHMTEMENLAAQMQRAQNMGIAPTSSQFRDFELQRQRIAADLQISQQRRDDLVRRLAVGMWMDVYRFFNFACRNFGNRFGYMMLITAMDDQLSADMTAENEAVLPQNVLNEIMIRNIQWIHPSSDVTAWILRDLNEHYRQHKTNRNLPIYPPPAAAP